MTRFLILVVQSTRSEQISARGERAVAVSLVHMGKCQVVQTEGEARHLPCRRFPSQKSRNPTAIRGLPRLRVIG